MLYLRRTFTCPASNTATDKQWDLAFLSKEEYQKKYNVSNEQYERLTKR
jgi:hypothetical protein